MKVDIILAIIGIGSFFAIGFYTNWKVALAIYIAIFINNIVLLKQKMKERA